MGLPGSENSIQKTNESPFNAQYMKSKKNTKKGKTDMFFDEKNNRISTTGFTLTETMVVVVVFTFVMSLALAVFLSSIRTQRTALFQQRLTTETSYALSMIEKKIRGGEEMTIGEINNYIENDFTSESIEVVNSDMKESEEMVTVFVKTKIKVGDGRDIEIKIQTTVKKR